MKILQYEENKRGVIWVSTWNFGSFTLYVLMSYFIQNDKIEIGLSIVYLYNMGSQVTSSNFLCFMYM